MNFRQWFESRGAADGPQPLTEREEEIMTRIAAKVVEWQMTVPAILFLESVKPLNYIGAQTMVFFEPFVQALFNVKDYDTFRQMMEQRENVERLLLKIEELDAEALKREKAARAARRAQRPGFWRRFLRRARQEESPPRPPKVP